MIPDDLKKPKEGGRPSNHSILLTEDQFEWMQHNVESLVYHYEKDNSRPKVKKLLGDLETKLASHMTPHSSDVSGRIAVKTNKDEVHLLLSMVQKSLDALKLAIGEYGRRGLTKNERYQQAVTRNQSLEDLKEQLSKRTNQT